MRNWLVVWLSLAAASAAAEEQSSLFLSPRALGRGGTGLAAFESTESARLNPAQLAEVKSRVQLRPLQLDVMVGNNSIDTINDLLKLSTADDGLGFLRSFDDKFGKRQYLRGQVSPLTFRVGAFELQPYASASSWLELRQPTMIEASFEADTLAGLQFSYARALGTQWELGASLRSLSRTYIHGEMAFTDVIEFAPPSTVEFEDYAPLLKGQGWGGDLGLIWRPTPLFRLGLTIENVGDTAFKPAEVDKTPPPLLQHINVGSFYRFKFGLWDLDLLGEWRDLLRREQQHPLRSLHLGTEFGRPLFTKDHDVGLLGGVQDGYLTAGGFIDVWIFRLDLSSYAVELGEIPGQRMDRRWAFSMQTSASF